MDSYRVRELCSTICGRSDVRLPVIIAGASLPLPLARSLCQPDHPRYSELCLNLMERGALPREEERWDIVDMSPRLGTRAVVGPPLTARYCHL